MKKTVVDALAEATFEEEDFQESPPHDIVAYNELRSCADLFRMYDSGALNIAPNFQRDVVWKSPSQTRFIDSLIKQLPIPSLCFSYDYKNEEWQVIDGLQRISSIIKFLEKDSGWTLSDLPDIDSHISGKPVAEFHEKGKPLEKLKRRVENATLPITVLRCDPSLSSHSNYLFTIFHRLNTAGMKLNNQEIRNCIYSGSFNELLKTLDSDKNWLALHGLKTPKSDRFRRQELILRFFAFWKRFEAYKEGLAKFLNDFMGERKSASATLLAGDKELFERVVAVINSKLGAKISGKITLTLLESLLVGVGRNIDKLEGETSAQLEERFANLQVHEEFTDAKLSEGLSKTARVLGRMNAAVQVFS